MYSAEPQMPHERVRFQIRNLMIPPVQKDTLEKIMERPVPHIRDERFEDSKLMASVMARKVNVLPATALTSEETEILFLQLNYTRYMMRQLQIRLLIRPYWHKNEALALLEWHKKQFSIRNKIITSNMGLVLSMARHAGYYGVDFAELISEGSMALLRASEHYDNSRGFKFSTYACRAILKSFSRMAKQIYRYRHFFPMPFDVTLEKDNHIDQIRQTAHKDRVDELQSIFRDNTAELSQTEKAVVSMRFSLSKEDIGPMTLKQVGNELGLSKERIRQIQNKALGKLRTIAHERLVSV